LRWLKRFENIIHKQPITYLSIDLCDQICYVFSFRR